MVTSTSLLVNMPGWDDALPLARSTPALGIGVHINLTQGQSLERVPSLTDSRTGHFRGIPALVARALAGRLDADEVYAECRAQISRVRSAGVSVTHVDSHMHAHLLPAISGPLVRAAADEGIHAVRWPRERLTPFWWDVSATMKRLALQAALGVRGTPPPGVRSPDHFAGTAVQGGGSRAERIAGLLDSLESGTTELMVHPGYVDAQLVGLDNYTWQREQELAALMSGRVRGRLARGDIQLVSFASV